MKDIYKKPEEDTKTAIGLMSGTSMDSIDACLLKIHSDFSFEYIASHSLTYPPEVIDKLMTAANDYATTFSICNLNFVVAKLFAQCVNELIEKSNYPRNEIDYIASHGQTIFHIPYDVKVGGITTKSTLQIGDISVIAEETGITTIGNFRSRDVAVGGQGAPLVPFADELIFKRHVPRAIQNIGGIANVTILSPDTDTFAFDNGPGNILIDYFTKKYFGLPFDAEGKLAANGKVDEHWLERLMEEPYYYLEPPKTTGRELFNSDYAQKLFNSAPSNHCDAIATITALSAKSIAESYKNFVFPKTNLREIVIGGGGAYNKTLINCLKSYLPGINIKTHKNFGINDKLKEAIAFAFLGYCTLKKLPNNLPNCTGAKKAVVMGEIAY